MNVKAYTGAFDQAMWHLVHTACYRTAWADERGEGWVDAGHVTRFKQELTVGSLYRIASYTLKVGRTSLRSFHTLYNVDQADPTSTCEMVSVYFDLKTRMPKPIDDDRVSGLRLFESSSLVQMGSARELADSNAP